MRAEMALPPEADQALAARVPNRAWSSAVPIVAADGKALEQFGTGTLFAVADQFFVVTAGHVIRRADKLTKSLGISDDDNSLIADAGNWVVATGGRRDGGQPADVAIYHLPGDAAERFKGKQFLRFDDIDYESQSATAVYMLFGFPPLREPRQSGTFFTLAPLKFTTLRLPTTAEDCRDFQDRLHLLLHSEPRVSKTNAALPSPYRTDYAQAAELPALLDSVGGCSVWRVGDMQTPLAEWPVETARLVAVETAADHAQRAIRSTKWIGVSLLIQEEFPKLGPQLNLWRYR